MITEDNKTENNLVTEKKLIELRTDSAILQRIIISRMDAKKINAILKLRDEMDAEKLILPSTFFKEFKSIKDTLIQEVGNVPTISKL